MAKRVEIINAKPERIKHYYTGSGGLSKGQFAKLDSATAVACTEGIGSAILLGVSMGDYLATEICDIYPVSGTEFELHIYQGSSTDTFTDANVGTPFDIFVDTLDTYIDPNDTSGAFLVLMTYDNVHLTATCRALKAVCYDD